MLTTKRIDNYFLTYDPGYKHKDITVAVKDEKNRLLKDLLIIFNIVCNIVLLFLFIFLFILILLFLFIFIFKEQYYLSYPETNGDYVNKFRPN